MDPSVTLNDFEMLKAACKEGPAHGPVIPWIEEMARRVTLAARAIGRDESLCKQDGHICVRV